jgi:hypothetical protein
MNKTQCAKLLSFAIAEVPMEPHAATTTQIVKRVYLNHREELKELGLGDYIDDPFLYDKTLRQLKNAEKKGIIKSQLFNYGKVRHNQNYSYLSWSFKKPSSEFRIQGEDVRE